MENTSEKSNFLSDSKDIKNSTFLGNISLEKSKKIMNASYIGGSIGFVGGLTYAFRKQKSFWGYVGYGILFSIIGSTVTGVGAFAIIKDEAKPSEPSGENTKGTVGENIKPESTTTDYNAKKASDLLEQVKKIKENSKANPKDIAMYVAQIKNIEEQIKGFGYKVVVAQGGDVKLQKA